MRRAATCIILIVFLYCQCAPRHHTLYRKLDVPVIISEVVGETIDVEERDQYDLFQGVDDFEQAIFYPIARGGLVAEIKTKAYMLTTVYPETDMHMILREYIEEYEWIQSYKEVFERKWQIVDYDALGFPITKDQVAGYVGPMAGCGCGLASAAATLAVFSGMALGMDYDVAPVVFAIGVGASLIA
jgi:hypothetical protein